LPLQERDILSHLFPDRYIRIGSLFLLPPGVTVLCFRKFRSLKGLLKCVYLHNKVDRDLGTPGYKGKLPSQRSELD